MVELRRMEKEPTLAELGEMLERGFNAVADDIAEVKSDIIDIKGDIADIRKEMATQEDVRAIVRDEVVTHPRGVESNPRRTR